MKYTTRVCISILALRVRNALHFSHPADAGLSSSRANVYKTDEAETEHVSECIMYRHVTASDPLRDVMVTLSRTVG